MIKAVAPMKVNTAKARIPTSALESAPREDGFPKEALIFTTVMGRINTSLVGMRRSHLKEPLLNGYILRPHDHFHLRLAAEGQGKARGKIEV